MNKILYTSGEFYLLQDWPDDDYFKFWKDDIEKEIEQMKFNKSIEQSKSNKIKISNPELLPVHWVTTDTTSYFLKHQQLKDGDTFDFPEGLKVGIQTELFKTRPFVNDDGDIIGYDAAEVKIAILSEEDNSHTEGSEEPKDSVPEFIPNGFKQCPNDDNLLCRCDGKCDNIIEPKEEESQEELVKEIEAYLLKNISGNGLQIMRFIEYLKQHFRIERIKDIREVDSMKVI